LEFIVRLLPVLLSCTDDCPNIWAIPVKSFGRPFLLTLLLNLSMHVLPLRIDTAIGAGDAPVVGIPGVAGAAAAASDTCALIL